MEKRLFEQPLFFPAVGGFSPAASGYFTLFTLPGVFI